MLMPMRRLGFALVLSIAMAIACEPLIHTHPLTQTSNSPCAVCVSAIGRVPSLAPTTISPLVLIAAIAPLVAGATAEASLTSLPSRAPPAL